MKTQLINVGNKALVASDVSFKGIKSNKVTASVVGGGAVVGVLGVAFGLKSLALLGVGAFVGGVVHGYHEEMNKQKVEENK